MKEETAPKEAPIDYEKEMKRDLVNGVDPQIEHDTTLLEHIPESLSQAEETKLTDEEWNAYDRRRKVKERELAEAATVAGKNKIKAGKREAKVKAKATKSATNEAFRAKYEEWIEECNKVNRLRALASKELDEAIQGKRLAQSTLNTQWGEWIEVKREAKTEALNVVKPKAPKKSDFL